MTGMANWNLCSHVSNGELQLYQQKQIGIAYKQIVTFQPLWLCVHIILPIRCFLMDFAIPLINNYNWVAIQLYP